MTPSPDTADVLIVGAGMAGLSAAEELRNSGLSAIVLDKGRSPGGRMATREIGGARFDHGAQHFSARSERFRTRVDELRDRGVVADWYRARSWTNPDLDIEPRIIGKGGMRRIPEHLAQGHDVRTSTRVDRLQPTDGSITAFAGGDPVARASSVILTPPVPQLLALLRTTGVETDSDMLNSLETVRYNPCLTVMATLDRSSGLEQGHVAEPTEDVAWIADNQHKGASQLPAITIHSTSSFAVEHLETDTEAWTQHLCARFAPLVDARIVSATGHRWVYAEPQTTLDLGAVALGNTVPVVLAGEVFAGAKVEGAFLSGAAAVEAILDRL